MKFTSRYRYADISPRKIKPVADLIRGKHVNDALQILRATTRKASFLVDKALRSAVANADESLEADMEGLRVKEVRVDEGPRRYKWHARARGQAVAIRSRSSHINIVLDDGQ